MVHRAHRPDDRGRRADDLRQGDPGHRGRGRLLPVVRRRAPRRPRDRIAARGAPKPKYSESNLDLVGNTPLLRLQKVTAGLKPTILAKLEELNPGGSVKDTIALTMLEQPERTGQLRLG